MGGAVALRVVWLSGRPYWWDRADDGRLTLKPATWIKEPTS